MAELVREEPASVGQRLLALMDHYRGRDSALNEQVLWRLRGPYDHEAMTRAVAALTARHEPLRTTYPRGRRMRQQIHVPRPVPVPVTDVSAEADPGAAAREIVATEVATGVDASVWPLRPRVVRLDAEHHLVVLTLHHYCSDDYSNALLARDLRSLYAVETGETVDLPAPQWQYAQWARWQADQLSGANLTRLTDYWTGKLTGARLVDLPARRRRPVPDGEPPWISVEHYVDAETTAALRQLARRHRTTLFPVTLAVFYALLYAETGADDLTVASLFANRSQPQVRDTVGFFASMVLLRERFTPDTTLSELIAQARTTVMDAMRHQDLPHQLLPPDTVAGGTGRTDDVLFQLLGSLMTRADMAGEELDDMEAQLERRRFALEFVVVPQGDQLSALLLCSRAEFDPLWADTFVRDYVTLVRRAVADADVPLARLRGAPVT
ncbi:condensation domain-containing protein [Micromonospora sp. NPDC047793]|uniref:condensation domain-containing protein n=1 Tax=Micromonospora sp. NPDC047793 TaxID=3154342 RepID=UPI0033FB14EA